LVRLCGVGSVATGWSACVWMALAARQVIGKIFAIFFPIMAFVPSGLSTASQYVFHPDGNIIDERSRVSSVPGVDPNLLGWINFLWRNLLPVTLGNIIGGGFFVGMSYWGAYLRPKND